MKVTPNTLSDVAPRLADLKKLPLEQKCHFFLARLANIGQQSMNALNKHNLMMSGDPYALAYGYPEAEKNLVNQVPCTAPVKSRLPSIPGSPSSDGLRPMPGGPTSDPGNRRVFISYSWDSDEHKAWVLSLANRLRGDGIDAILDQTHLGFGGRTPEFMERSVRDSRSVLVICTNGYKQRFDGRKVVAASLNCPAANSPTAIWEIVRSAGYPRSPIPRSITTLARTEFSST
jgi:hypothetical protein